MDKVVHFELPVENLDRAKKFYSSTFGWGLTDWPMPGGMVYTMATTTPVDEQTYMPKEPGAINGGMIQRHKPVNSPVITINVSSIDQYAKKIEAAGGKLIMPKAEVPDMGYYAYFTDTEGNVVGLWENMKKQ